MDLGSIFLLLALFILVGLYISKPLIERSATAVTREEHDISMLMAERERLIVALQELEFDHALGKVPEEDFPEQRASLLQRGADILRQLDEATGIQHAGMEDPLEAAIAARKQGTAAFPAADPDDSLEAMIADRRRDRQESSSGFCPQCGTPVQKSDKFCSKCGTDLE